MNFASRHSYSKLWMRLDGCKANPAVEEGEFDRTQNRERAPRWRSVGDQRTIVMKDLVHEREFGHCEQVLFQRYSAEEQSPYRLVVRFHLHHCLFNLSSP